MTASSNQYNFYLYLETVKVIINMCLSIGRNLNLKKWENTQASREFYFFIEILVRLTLSVKFQRCFL